ARLGGPPDALAGDPRVQDRRHRPRTVGAHVAGPARSGRTDSDRGESQERGPALGWRLERVDVALDLRDEAGATVVAEPFDRSDRKARVRWPGYGAHVGEQRQDESEDRCNRHDRGDPSNRSRTPAAPPARARAGTNASPGADGRPGAQAHGHEEE